MKQNEFSIPPISTLIGSTLPNFFRVLAMGHVSWRHLPKLLLTFLAIVFSTPFQLVEYIYFSIKQRHIKLSYPPVFIIGHWRSGTTHLHNLLCQDPQHGYVTTFQSVFPNNMLSKWIFKAFMRKNIPDKRPSDNVRLSPDFPQEEEFALGNMSKCTFYHYFYFPSLREKLYEKYVRFHGLTDAESRGFEKKYRELLCKASLNMNGRRLIVKNPMNTGKIKRLCEMFPEAKFIHIYRNPLTTYFSTMKFFLSLLPTTALEKYEEEKIQKDILSTYKKLMRDYFATKKLIPTENLVEVQFETFEKDPLAHLQKIYKKLDLGPWEKASVHIEKYMELKKNYRKNTYVIPEEEKLLVTKKWQFAFEKLGYPLPVDIAAVKAKTIQTSSDEREAG